MVRSRKRRKALRAFLSVHFGWIVIPLVRAIPFALPGGFGRFLGRFHRAGAEHWNGGRDGGGLRGGGWTVAGAFAQLGFQFRFELVELIHLILRDARLGLGGGGILALVAGKVEL